MRQQTIGRRSGRDAEHIRIIQSKYELLHTGVLKKYGTHIDRACSWRFSALEKLLKPLNERNRKALENGSLQLYEMHFVQHTNLAFNCKAQ